MRRVFLVESFLLEASGVFMRQESACRSEVVLVTALGN